jgi:hypothetical protein
MANVSVIKLKVRRGTDLERQKIILDQGEIGYTIDSKRLFVGDGSTTGGIAAGVKYITDSISNPTGLLSTAQIGDIILNTDNTTFNILTGTPYTSLNSYVVLNNSYALSLSSNYWNSTYTTVRANSGSWGTGGGSTSLGQIPVLSANWNNSYTTLTANSAYWQSTYTFLSAATATTFNLNNLSARGSLSAQAITLTSLNSATNAFNTSLLTIVGAASGSIFESLQNTVAGVSASADISIYNDQGTYIDLGIASSQYNGNLYGPAFNTVAPGDGYLYTTNNNLALGTAGTGIINFFTGGTLSATNTRATISNAGLTVNGNIYGGTGITNLSTAATYTIQLSDNGGMIASTNNTAGLTATVTSSISYPTGFSVGFMQLSGSTTTGRIAVSGLSITINQANSYFKTTKQYSTATLMNFGGSPAIWVLFGDVAL